jgi:hypothetical protein
VVGFNLVPGIVSIHVTPNNKFLFNVQVCSVKVTVAQGTLVAARRRGYLLVQSECGGVMLLQGVLVIPTFSKNIISGSRLIHGTGYTAVVINDTRAEVVNNENKKLNMKFNVPGRLWYLEGTRQQANKRKFPGIMISDAKARRKSTKSSSINNNSEFTEYVSVNALPVVQGEKKRLNFAHTVDQYEDLHEEVKLQIAQEINSAMTAEQVKYVKPLTSYQTAMILTAVVEKLGMKMSQFMPKRNVKNAFKEGVFKDQRKLLLANQWI